MKEFSQTFLPMLLVLLQVNKINFGRFDRTSEIKIFVKVAGNDYLSHNCYARAIQIFISPFKYLYINFFFV